jgi:hypothetical protein
LKRPGTTSCTQPQARLVGVGPGTAGDIITVLQGCRHNPEGVPLPIRRELDGTLNISDIDVCMWLKKLSPKSRPLGASLKALLISLFSKPGNNIPLQLEGATCPPSHWVS